MNRFVVINNQNTPILLMVDHILWFPVSCAALRGLVILISDCISDVVIRASGVQKLASDWPESRFVSTSEGRSRQ